MDKRDYIKSDYFYNKCIWGIACSNEPKENISYLFNFFGLDVFEMYWALDSFFAQNNDSYLDKDSKINLGYLIRYLKDRSNGEYEFRHMEANLRESNDKTNDFILSQCKKRFMYGDEPSELVFSNKRQQNFDFLKSVVVNDMKVLMTHSSRCDSRTFNTIKINEFVNDSTLKYIGSINMIIDEFPEILGNQLFVDRVRMVLNRLDEKAKTSNMQLFYTKFKRKHGL